MTEKQAIEYLHSLPRMGGGATLRRMRSLMEHLGNPQNGLRYVHVAGTNGKGTVCTLTASILQHAGYKVGLTISPYVLEFRERYQINGDMIPKRTLGALVSKVKKAVEQMTAAGEETPVEFEAVTAVAFLWFAQEKCDFVVLETGLGGRFDATNVIENPMVCAITCIGLDHTAQLGTTLDKIASEKAGIIKPGCTIVTYPEQPKLALQEIIAAAAEQECELVVPDAADLERRKSENFENIINYGGYRANLPWPGKHQAYNAAMAVEIALALWRKGIEVDDDAILDGLEMAAFPARIEVFRKEPLVLLDGSHNPDGGKALGQTLAENQCESMTLILGMMADKNVGEYIKAIAPYFSKMVAVQPDYPRAMDVEQLATVGRKYIGRVETDIDVHHAITQAINAGNDVVVCGSLYLASQARPIVLECLKKKK